MSPMIRCRRNSAWPTIALQLFELRYNRQLRSKAHNTQLRKDLRHRVPRGNHQRPVGPVINFRLRVDAE